MSYSEHDVDISDNLADMIPGSTIVYVWKRYETEALVVIFYVLHEIEVVGLKLFNVAHLFCRITYEGTVFQLHPIMREWILKKG